jgi:ferredoxin
VGREKVDLSDYGDQRETDSVTEGALRFASAPWPAALEEVTMRVVVDYDLCKSNAVCVDILPEVFEVRADNFLYLLNEHPPEDQRAKVLEAVASCPTRAISVVED